MQQLLHTVQEPLCALCVLLRLSKHAPATCIGSTVLRVWAAEFNADPLQRGAWQVVTEALDNKPDRGDQGEDALDTN